MEQDVKDWNYEDFVVKMYCCEDMEVSMASLCYTIFYCWQVQKNCKNQLCYFTLKLTESLCTCIMSPVEASHKFHVEICCMKTKEDHFEMVIH